MPGCPKVGIIVPVHNGVSHTLGFLESVSRITYPSYELIIIDDGSTDGTSEKVRERFPAVRLIAGDGNLWWTKAVNLGVRAALSSGCEYVLTINNDVTVEQGFLEPLVACSAECGGAVVGPKIYYMREPGRVWSTGGRIRWYSGKLFYTADKGEADGPAYSKRRDVEFVHGMGGLVPAYVFGKVGLFDELNYPQYNADAEFTMRAARAGVRLMVEPKSRIYNDAGHSRALDLRRSLRLVGPLLDPYSPYNLRMNWALYRDYAPGPAARWLGFLIKYLRFFAGTLRYIFPSGGPAK